MILPIGHEQREVRRLPWVTFSVMGACVAIFLGTDIPSAPWTGPGAPDNAFTNWGLTPTAPRALHFVTHMFVHGGWLHLLGNLFLFYLAAPAVEDRLGRPAFAGLFLLAGLFAATLHLVMNPESALPMVGASGAIAGILGAFCVRFWSTKISFVYFFFLGFRPVTGTFEAPAWLMLPVWFASELFQATLSTQLGVETGVAYWAHVGGFACGAAATLAVRQTGIEERFLHPAIERKVTLASANPALEQALEAREQGDIDAAYDLLEPAVRADPEDPDLALAFWDTAVAGNRAADGAPAMALAVRAAASRGDIELAIQHWTELTRSAPDALADPATLLRLAPALLASGQTRPALHALRQVLDPRQRGLTPGSALRVMTYAREIDPPIALLAGRRALEFADLDETKRARLADEITKLELSGVNAPSPSDLAAPSLDSLERDPQQGRSLDIESDETSEAIERDLALAQAARQSRSEPDRRVELSPHGDLVAAVADADLTEPEAPSAPVPSTPPPLPATAPLAPPALPVERSAAPGPIPPPLPAEARTPAADAQALGSDLARFSDLKVVEATPAGFESEALLLRTSDGRSARMPWDRIQAIAVAAIEGLGPQPVVVIDLALNWRSLSEEPLRVLRLRSDAFDPRQLIGDANSLEAFRGLLAKLLDASGAAPLPDSDAARGRPFASFRDVAGYQREVLSVA